ncbi:unnamed protein product [Meganyctiphanes norvegica]|uniref:Uncharacterized protein n=1 Tax=Meganyctiphanes norvegica TaxID=48144 RepID=A0AAV2SN35_MEGNR
MYVTHITINNQLMVSNTLMANSPPATIEKYMNHSQKPKVSLSLSSGSSIIIIPSMNTSTMIPFVFLQDMATSSSEYSIPEMQNFTEKSSSSSNSEASSDLATTGLITSYPLTVA